MHPKHLAQCLAGGKLQTAPSCCVVFSAWGCVHSEWRLGFGNHSFSHFFLFRGENKGPGPGHPHPLPPCGLTLSRASSMETARRENSSTTRAATRTPTMVRIRASPARCTVSSDAHRACSLCFSRRSSGWLWRQTGARAEETDRGCRTTSLVPGGGPGAPSHSLG